MKSRNVLCIIAFAAAVLQGCALDPQAEHDRADRVYVTGSNIARKQQAGEVSVMSAEAYERARSSVTPPVPMGPGGSR